MTLLATESRTLYTECLTAPDGYRFDRGIATTFTLSLETLLVLPFTLATQSAEDPEQLMSDPLALLESLRETTGRLAVFCHEGYTTVPPKEQLLYGLLDHCVVPVRPPHPKGLFHPKLWLLRFVSDETQAVLLRAVVLSRNLTFDRSWDTVLCLDGEPTGRRVKNSFGLERLVLTLPDLATGPLSVGQRELCELLADEAARTMFETPDPFREGPRFHAIGIDDKRGRRLRFEPAIEGHARRMLCVSPFLSAPAMKRAREGVGEKLELITRPESAHVLSDDVLEGWTIRVLAEAVETGESADDAQPEDAVETLFSPPNGLHAKVVVIEDYQRRVSWFLGSANLTEAGWEGLNVELMVELRGGQGKCGIDAFLDGGLEEILDSWTRGEVDPEQEARTKLLDAANAARDGIARAGLHLRCAKEASSEKWSLELTGDAARMPSMRDEGVTARVWPLSLARGRHARDLVELAPESPLSWRMTSPAELTSLLAFEVTATDGDRSETIRFAVRLPIENLPDDRDAYILRLLVKDRSGFFRYLRYLLSADDEHAIPGLSTRLARRGETGEGSGFALGFEEVILEDLVRALSRNPKRLEHLDRRIADFLATDDVAQVIPQEFLELWQTIQAALPVTEKAPFAEVAQ